MRFEVEYRGLEAKFDVECNDIRGIYLGGRVDASVGGRKHYFVACRCKECRRLPLRRHEEGGFIFSGQGFASHCGDKSKRWLLGVKVPVQCTKNRDTSKRLVIIARWFAERNRAIKAQEGIVKGTRSRFWNPQTRNWVHGVYMAESARDVCNAHQGTFDWVWFKDSKCKEEVILASEKFEVIGPPLRRKKRANPTTATGGVDEKAKDCGNSNAEPSPGTHDGEDFNLNTNLDSNRERSIEYSGLGTDGISRIVEGIKQRVQRLQGDHESKVLAERTLLEKSQQQAKLLQKKMKRKELEVLELQGDLQSLKDLLKLHGLS